MLFKSESSKKTMKRLMRGLVAGTCLTAATSAHAGTINESTDFSNTLAGALSAPLAVGTNTVNGSVGVGDLDFVDFAGLLAGGSFTLQFTGTGGVTITQQQFSTFASFFDAAAFDSAGANAGSPGSAQLGVSSATFTGTIPNDGQLIAQVSVTQLGIAQAGLAVVGGASYQINLTAPLADTAAPEPATAALAATGLALAGLVRARRRKQ